VSLRTGIRDALEASLFVDGTITERVPMPRTLEPYGASISRPRTIGPTLSYRDC